MEHAYEGSWSICEKPQKKQIPTNEELEDIKSYFNFGIE